VVKLKLQYFGHVTRGIAGQLALTVLEGSMEGTRGQRAMEEEDTGMVSCCRQPSDEEGRLEREIVIIISSSFMSVCRTVSEIVSVK